MIIIVDERNLVQQGFTSQFTNEGFPSAGFGIEEFEGWINTANEQDLASIKACLICETLIERLSPKAIRKKTNSPVIALVDNSSLEKTLHLFQAGVDDVIKKPVHVQEILARIAAIQRRTADKESSVKIDRLRVFLDGRDATVDGSLFPLPRRERRILEYLASIGQRRADKSQIFNAIYGVFNEDVEENVIESHISKLRKKLRGVLGYDPIDSKRYLGYRLMECSESERKRIYDSNLIGEPA